MNDPNNSPSSAFPHRSRSNSSSSPSASSCNVDNPVDDVAGETDLYQASESLNSTFNQGFQDDYNRFAATSGETAAAVSLEPRPIRHMNLASHIPAVELQIRDPSTAQMVRELFFRNPFDTSSPHHSSSTLMMSSSYRRISTGYFNVEETKLEPSLRRTAYEASQYNYDQSRREGTKRSMPSYSSRREDPMLMRTRVPHQLSASAEMKESSGRTSLKPPPRSSSMKTATVAASVAAPTAVPSSAAFSELSQSAATSSDGYEDEAAESDKEGERPKKRGRFRAFKSGQWFQRFQELVQYKERFGSCHVPHNWEHNVRLAQWVKRQRYQYTLREDGKHSTLTDDRKEALDDIGFVWSSHTAVWLERLEELRQFKKQFGHSNVPKNYPANKALAVWIKSQRRQYKLFLTGKQGTMTPERVTKLNELGFDWDPRSTASNASDKKPSAESQMEGGDGIANYDSSSESSAASGVRGRK